MPRVPNEKAQARADAQRDRILDAAYSCFVEMGFHGAGMAAISERADMSPGLIYRYFPSGKSEIILAIIGDQLLRAEEHIGTLQGSDHFSAFMACLNPGDIDRRRMNFPLMLELSALASRDPSIAAAVSEFDTRIRAAVTAWVTRLVSSAHGFELPPSEAFIRATMFQVLFEGMAVRAAREPDIDRAMASAAIEQMLSAVTAPPAGTAPTDPSRGSHAQAPAKGAEK